MVQETNKIAYEWAQNDLIPQLLKQLNVSIFFPETTFSDSKRLSVGATPSSTASTITNVGYQSLFSRRLNPINLSCRSTNFSTSANGKLLIMNYYL